jgi:uncharacterized membrane protein
MVYLILAAAVAAVAMGFSPVPVMVIGAISVALTSYLMTRHASVLRMGIALAIIAISRLLLKTVSERLPQTDTSGFLFEATKFVTSDGLIMTISALVMLIATAIAIFDIRGLELPKELSGKLPDQNNREK